MTDIFYMLLLAVIGLVSGVINVLAGGGSLLTLPLLIFLGLPASVANGTNRLAILTQSVAAIGGFRAQGMLSVKLALLCTVPALVGSVIGAQLAIDIDDQLFNKLLGLIMLGVVALMVFDPAKRFKFDPQHMTPLRTALLLLTFFGVGLYGGFVQAGVGFLIICGLLVHGLDLVRINAVKVFVILFFTITALAVFVWHGQVNYSYGIALAAGSFAGGWLGTRIAVKKGHDWIRKVVFAVVILFAIKLFFT